MAIIYQAVYCLFCVGMAFVNFRIIAKGKRVKHFYNGLIHSVSAAVCFWLFGWNIALAVLLLARVVFDLSLNFYRGLPADYVSPNPKSIVDQIEKRIFGNDGMFPKLLYLGLTVLLNFF